MGRGGGKRRTSALSGEEMTTGVPLSDVSLMFRCRGTSPGGTQANRSGLSRQVNPDPAEASGKGSNAPPAGGHT